MDCLRVLAVAPYEGLKETILTAASHRDDIWLDAFVADLDESRALMTSIDSRLYDIIISRGGTIDRIEKYTALPIIEIDVSYFDILKMLRLAQGYTGRTALVGFPSITQKARDVCSILDMDIEICTISSESETRDCLRRLAGEGVGVVIGDTITSKTARSIGMNYLLITSGEDSVIKAFDEAKKTYGYLSDLKTRLSLQTRVLEHAPYSAIITGEDGRIIESWGMDPSLEKAIPGQLIGSGQGTFSFRENHHIHFAQRKEFTEEGEKRYIHYLSSIPEKGDGMLSVSGKSYTHSLPLLESQLGSNNPAVKRLLKEATAAAHSRKNVLVTGELGSGKTTLIRAIHRESHNPFLAVLECGFLQEEDLQIALSQELELLTSQGTTTLFIKDKQGTLTAFDFYSGQRVSAGYGDIAGSL